jgi:hypothetical protein
MTANELTPHSFYLIYTSDKQILLGIIEVRRISKTLGIEHRVVEWFDYDITDTDRKYAYIELLIMNSYQYAPCSELGKLLWTKNK